MLCSLCLLASMLCAESPEESFHGVSRESLVEHLRGPGAEIGKRKAAESVELHENALKAAKNATIDRRVEGIKFEIAKNGRITARAQSREAKEAGIRAAERKLAEARAMAANPEPYMPRLSVFHLETGKIGRLREAVSHVPREQDGQQFTVQQVLDEGSCIASLNKGRGDREVVWIDQPTAGMVDGKTYATGDAIYEVVGTTTYSTAIGGTKTVFRLKRVTLDELRPKK